MKLIVCIAVLAMMGSVSAEPTKDAPKKDAPKETPMARTVKLIEDLRKQVKTDGKAEQAEFDAYACWCEKTMERKAADISAAKELITETEILIKKLKGEIASHQAEIEQLEKDIAQNKEAIREAQELRNKEYKEYEEERNEAEQCIGALEAAIKVLTNTGTKKFFLQTIQKAELLSIVGGLRTAILHKVATQAVSEKDIQVMKHFVASPDDFFATPSHSMSAAQIGQNPFGDYAPQSTQIQGILKGMYDAFTSDLEKENAQEANAEKAFQELYATKLQELKTLELTLQRQESNLASKNKKLADSEVLLDDTQTQLEADERFFADTKEACAAKASEWSVRTRLRTEELNGMDQAINILSSEEAQKTFENSTTTFLQMSSVHKTIHSHKHAESNTDRSKAYDKLKTLATKLQSRSVAKIAVLLKTGGHFDKVIEMIDTMIVLLRKEEQDDIDHRDRCQNGENANKNEIDDLDHTIGKTEKSIKRMKEEVKGLEDEISALEKEIEATEKDMKELLDFRNEEVADFRQAMKDDTDAVGLLRKAIEYLTEFYKRNDMKVPTGLVQKAEPEYTKDPDVAPEVSWSGEKYGGRKGETGGVIAILEMLVEDVQKEIKEAKKDDAEAQEKYLKQNGALTDTLDSQKETKANTEKEKADLEEKIDSYEDFKGEKEADKEAQEATKKALYTDCSWIPTHFETRREKRQNEIQGLQDAKAFLAGAENGDGEAGELATLG
jgi:predicted  nucleic acid-binding Zn-ribbon protein